MTQAFSIITTTDGKQHTVIGSVETVTDQLNAGRAVVRLNTPGDAPSMHGLAIGVSQVVSITAKTHA